MLNQSDVNTRSYALMAWLSWGIAALFVLFQFLLQSSTSIMIPCLEIAFHTDASGVALLSSGFFYSYIIMQIPSGILIDRYGAKKILSLGLIVAALASLVFSRAQHFAMAEFSRILMGFVCAPAVVGSFYIAANWFPAKRFALIVGLTEMLGMLGGALGEAYLGYCVGKFGWRNTLLLTALIGFILALLALLFIKDKPNEVVDPREKKELITFRMARKQVWAVIKKSQSWYNGLFTGFTFIIINAFAGLWAVPFFERLYGISVEKAALISSMIYIGAGVGSPCAGWISDFMSRRKPIMLINTLICIAISIVIIYVSIPITLMFVLAFFLGVTASSYVVPFAILKEMTPKAFRGTAMGYNNMMCIIIGAPIVQMLISALLKWHWDGKIRAGIQVFSLSNYHFALAIMPICLLLAIITWFFIKETHCTEMIEEEVLKE